MGTAGLWLTAVVIAVGLVGILVPVLPGILLVITAVLVWAVVEGTASGWIVFGLAATITVASQVTKYVVPGRRLQHSGVPPGSALAGAVVGVVGFFVIPVIGLVIGFVAGIYVTERLRLRSHAGAWRSTVEALKAAGLSLVIELAAGLAVAITWLIGVALS